MRIGPGRDVTADQRAAAVEARGVWQDRISAALDGVGRVLTPTLPVDVPRADPDDVLRVSRRRGQLTYPWSLHAGPTLALPVGVRLTAPEHAEDAEDAEDVVLAAGLWFQEQADGHTRRSPATA